MSSIATVLAGAGLNPSVDFINPVNIQVIERDFPSADDILGSFNQSCVAGNYTQQATNFGALYELDYTVTVDS